MRYVAIHGRGIDLQKLEFQGGKFHSNQWLGTGFFSPTSQWASCKPLFLRGHPFA